MDNVTILYQGGSGGFALYYYLLLSGNYQFSTGTAQSMIARQFPTELATDPKNWKAQEFWPDNSKLKQAQGPSVFLLCNPLFNRDMYQTNQMIASDTYKILLYTDLRLQLRMAWDKQAYWFTDVSKEKFNAAASNKQYLRQIINSQHQKFDPELDQVRQQFKPNQEIRLEDLIQKKTVPGFSNPDSKQIAFLNYWYSLQSPKAVKLLER
jgi:hypothetical protein